MLDAKMFYELIKGFDKVDDVVVELDGDRDKIGVNEEVDFDFGNDTYVSCTVVIEQDIDTCDGDNDTPSSYRVVSEEIFVMVWIVTGKHTYHSQNQNQPPH